MYKPVLKCGWVALLVLLPWLAQAAGLGELRVLSTLGHPLLAEIDLISVPRNEMGMLSVRLGSPEAYRKADLQYGAALTGMRLSIEKRPDGHPYIKVSSTRTVNEPFLNLMIELNAPSGLFTRQYTALIDPPGYTPPELASAPAAEARPVPPPAPLTARPTPPATGTARARAAEYGPVKRGETLSKIAASVRPDGVSLEQMLVGIFRSNKEAFLNHNMNLLKAGATLEIPDKAALAATTRQEAVKEVRAQTVDWRAYRRRVADTASRVSRESRKEGAPAAPRVKVEDKAAAHKGAKDVLRLSRGQPPGTAARKGRSLEERVQALEEELIARERALNEANQRIKELEKAVKEEGK